jgi:hypothetical protein
MFWIVSSIVDGIFFESSFEKTGGGTGSLLENNPG